MTLPETFSHCCGLEADYFYFISALAWWVSAGFSAGFAAGWLKQPSTRRTRWLWLAVATAFFLFGLGSVLRVLGGYQHLMPRLSPAGDWWAGAIVGAVLLVVVVLPAPPRFARAWWRAGASTAAAVSAALLIAAPQAWAWWVIAAAAIAGPWLFFVSRRAAAGLDGTVDPWDQRMLGAAVIAAGVAWGGGALLEPSSAGAASADLMGWERFDLMRAALLAGAAGGVAIVQWIAYLHAFTLPRIQARRGLFGLRPAWSLPAAQTILLIVGYFLLSATSNDAQSYVSRRVLAEVRAVADSLNWERIMPALDDPSADAERAATLRRSMTRLVTASESYLGAVLWTRAGNSDRVLAAVAGNGAGELADVAPLLPDSAPEYAAVAVGQAYVCWVGGGARYERATAVVPVRAFAGAQTSPPWVLSLSIDARGLADLIATHRMQALTIVALAGLLVSFAGVYLVRSLNERELQALKESAETENNAKSEFIAMVSHEVRTPLQSVLGFAELAQAEALPPAAARHLRAIAAQGSILLRIVQDILDFSALRSGGMRLHLEPVPVRELAGEVQRAYADRAALKHIALSAETSDSVPAWVLVDRVRLSQVLVNLVGNAVKFTSRGGVRLEVGGRVNADGAAELEFAISDTGAGIPSTQLPRLFEPFRKLRNDDTPGGGGVGLGLAICRQVIERMGGSIAVDSVEGEGTTFRFRLTLPVAEAPRTAPAVEQEILEAASAAGDVSLAGLAVLLIEDNPYVRELMREFLRRQGAQVCTRPDGRSALDAAREASFDVILIDLRLPDIDGRELARLLRPPGASPREPWIVGISAGVSDLEIQNALNEGLNDFLLKPVSMAGLAETIRLSPAGAKVRPGEALDATMPEITPEMRAGFWTEATAVLQRMAAICENGAGGPAAAEAHYLANGCLMLGLTGPFELCRAIEDLAGRDACVAAAAKIAELREALHTAAENERAAAAVR